MRTAKLNPTTVTPLPAQMPQNTPDSVAGMDLTQVVRTVWRGKWIVLACMLCAITSCIAYIVYVATPIYTATSVVTLDNRNEQIVDFENVISGLAGDQASINTEVEVLRSRILVDKLVVLLNLEQDLEFNLFLEEPSAWSLDEVLRLMTGQVAEPPTAERIRDKTIDRVLESISVGNIRQSYVFRITARTEDAAKSALIADTLAEIYIAEQIDVKAEATQQATSWLSERVTELQVELEAAENAVNTFNSSTELISPEALEALNRKLKEFRDRFATLTAAESQLRDRVMTLESAFASDDMSRMAGVADDQALTQMLVRLSSGSEANRAAFDNRFEQIVGRARIELERNRSQRATLATSIDELESQVSSQSTDLLKLLQLQREAEASGIIYEYFLSRLKETSVQIGILQADSRLLSRAVTPERPSSPQKALMLIVFALIGFIVGAAIVIIREMRNNAFRTPAQMESETGVAVIGQVPRAPFARRKRVLDYIVNKPTSAMVEAVRNMRTSILLSNLDKEPQVIMMTSSVPGEGKTTLSLGLAQNLGSMGKKVLIIEGDMRRRTFREFFDLGDQRGLLAAVIENTPLKDVVYHNDLLDVDILIGERSSMNAADFFSSEKFAQFLERARSEYDYIVIDTPPVLVVPDARVIGQSADVVVYVVHWDSTPKTQVKQGIGSFAMVNAPVAGLVLSQIDPRGMRSYGYGSSYGYYGKGYYDN